MKTRLYSLVAAPILAGYIGLIAGQALADGMDYVGAAAANAAIGAASSAASSSMYDRSPPPSYGNYAPAPSYGTYAPPPAQAAQPQPAPVAAQPYYPMHSVASTERRGFVRGQYAPPPFGSAYADTRPARPTVFEYPERPYPANYQPAPAPVNGCQKLYTVNPYSPTGYACLGPNGTWYINE